MEEMETHLVLTQSRGVGRVRSAVVPSTVQCLMLHFERRVLDEQVSTFRLQLVHLRAPTRPSSFESIARTLHAVPVE